MTLRFFFLGLAASIAPALIGGTFNSNSAKLVSGRAWFL
jgi:hypothetical protein